MNGKGGVGRNEGTSIKGLYGTDASKRKGERREAGSDGGREEGEGEKERE
jgi:hypothetical protein